MNKKAVSAHRDQDHGTRSIQVNDDDQNFATIDCNNLVVAADPWSPALFQEIFPQSTSVEPVIPAGDWFFFGNPQVDTSIAAVYLDENVLSQKPEFAGQNNITIWAAGTKRGIGQVPDVGDEPQSVPDQRQMESPRRTYS